MSLDQRTQNDAAWSLVTVNGGSSSVRLAAYQWGETRRPFLRAHADGIGQERCTVKVMNPDGSLVHSEVISGADRNRAARDTLDLFAASGHLRIAAVGHRVVHGGPHLLQHQLIDPEVVAELRRVQDLDLAHLPLEIALIEACTSRYPNLPQVACFDTAFHRDLPQVAQQFAIPRRYLDSGVRRFGFHGLSYTYLLAAVRDLGGDEAADGRIIFAHLGSGASMSAVKGGMPMDTSMAFTPMAGILMGTRPGDMDPGLLLYLMQQENLSPDEMYRFITRECGLAGVSGGTSDLRELIDRRQHDQRAADAIDLFCYTARKWIGSYSAVLGGLDTLVFSGGIGERSVVVRASICAGLEYLGIRIDETRNGQSAAVISPDGSPVTVRVIPTDEEGVIARIVLRLVESTPRADAGPNTGYHTKEMV